MNNKNVPHRIGIIGAGIAGLTCGLELQKRGFQVELFDKGFNLGGRVATRYASRTDPSVYFDHGAQYFTAKSDVFHRQILAWVEEQTAALWSGRVGSVEKGNFEPEKQTHERFVGAPLMRSIAEYMAAQLSVRKNCRVEQVRRHENSWHLYLEGGAEVNGLDGLIVAIPPAQAAALLDDFSELKSACLQETMAPCWSVFVSFESRLDIPYDGLFVHQSPLSWICRDSSKPGRPPGERWVLHGSAAWSTQHLEEDGAAVASKLLTEFFRATGASVVKETFIKAHRWRYAIPEASNRSGILLSEGDALAICGDWCNGARVEGAYLSGCEAAAFICRSFPYARRRI